MERSQDSVTGPKSQAPKPPEAIHQRPLNRLGSDLVGPNTAQHTHTYTQPTSQHQQHQPSNLSTIYLYIYMGITQCINGVAAICVYLFIYYLLCQAKEGGVSGHKSRVSLRTTISEFVVHLLFFFTISAFTRGKGGRGGSKGICWKHLVLSLFFGQASGGYTYIFITLAWRKG